MWCTICDKEITGEQPYTHFADYTMSARGTDRVHAYWHDACEQKAARAERAASLNLKNFKLGIG